MVQPLHLLSEVNNDLLMMSCCLCAGLMSSQYKLIIVCNQATGGVLVSVLKGQR